jgi:negative regulator of flagellin synthesis FlgM
MAININNLQSNHQVKQKLDQQVQTKQQANVNSSQQSKLAAQDSVSLTPQAKQLSELEKKAGEAPVLNQKKIDELKKAITSGDYKINPEKLAASIANFEFKLG